MSRVLGYEGFGGAEVQTYFDRPDPRPQEGEILIKLRAAGVARIDMALRSGHLRAFNGHLPFPQVMGIEGAGDVLAIGAGVTDFRVGDAVFGFVLSGAGTYAETTLLPAANAARKPDGLSYESAAAIPVSGTTALDALDGLDLPVDATVLINGVGGSTGLVTAELARARGLTVIGTGSDSKRPVAEAVGITFVSYQAGDVSEQVRALAPAGVDGLIDLVGGDSMRSVAGLVKDARQLISVTDEAVGELGGRFVVRRLNRSGLEKVAALMVAGKTDAHISRSVPFDQAADAVAAVESGHSTGKVVITFAPDIMTGIVSENDTMNAVRQHTFGGPEVLSVERVERPAPLPTEVLVRVHAAGINPVDWKTRGGTGMAGVLGAPPFVLGWDVAGMVEEVGFGVTTLAPGDRVYGMPWFPRAAGGYAEYVTAPARQFARMPAGSTFEQAAAVPLAGLTAWQALVDTADVRPGQRVLITAAAGGVGHLAVQFAKHLGAYVIAVAGPRNQQWLAELGADEVVDYTTGGFEKEVRDVDVVVDLVGDAYDATSTRSLETLRPGGLLVAVPAGVSPELATAAAAAGVRVTGFLVEPDGPALARIAALIEEGAVTVEVAKVLPLAEVAIAHREGEQGHTRGKIVLRVADDRA